MSHATLLIPLPLRQLAAGREIVLRRAGVGAAPKPGRWLRLWLGLWRKAR